MKAPILLSIILCGAMSLSEGNAAAAPSFTNNDATESTPGHSTAPVAEDAASGSASLTEGVITSAFVPEREMMAGMLRMLADFSGYMSDNFIDCPEPNDEGEECGYFKGERPGEAGEQGVRPNADMSMVCAFLVKYARPAGVALPEGMTWERLAQIARKSLVYAYSTHKANRLKPCEGNAPYWGSVSPDDCSWESSLWAMSVAYSAHFQWDSLSEGQKARIHDMLAAECDYELRRDIPTGYVDDTKAEENGWEADVLAATLGLFPDDEMAESWFSRLREFAVNSYSHPSDARDSTVIDPDYDRTTVADLYVGQNLFEDYTLQNHRLFHTSYQNVVMQELGEAALALRLFQGEGAKWKTNALAHNCQKVMDKVLNWLALPDGELAMPNGNDWSLFLYDQITSYTTQACFQRDPNALMLENMAYKYIRARQQSTPDGTWLLRPDVGARRMGVQAHRVMMTYLMHLTLSTETLVPTRWENFRAEHGKAMIFPDQNIVRAFTRDRFTTFSWCRGLRSYTGYIAANSPDKNKIVVPFRADNTGNLLGWYTVEGRRTDAEPVVEGIYDLQGNGYTMNGELKTNEGALDLRFALYSTPGNAVIYTDEVSALSDGTVTGEFGGLLAISTDEFTRTERTVHCNSGSEVCDGTELKTFLGDWINIDDELGVVGRNGKSAAFGDRQNNNSILTSKLYPMYGNERRSFGTGEVIDRRSLVYYCNVNAQTTALLSDLLTVLTDSVPEGWNGAAAADPDGTVYMLLSNFRGEGDEAELKGIRIAGRAPVFKETTVITDSSSSVTISLGQNHSAGRTINFLVEGTGLTARLETDRSALITASQSGNVKVTVPGSSRTVHMDRGETVRFSLTPAGKLVSGQKF